MFYLTLLHLLESVRLLLSVSGDLDKLDTSESANAESGHDAEILKLQALELFVDAANEESK